MRAPGEQVSLPVRIEKDQAAIARKPMFAAVEPMPPPINGGVISKPTAACDGTVRHKTSPEVEAQEVKQGWSHMPCGVHAAPFRVELVMKSVVPDKMTPCTFATGGRTMPLLQDVIRIANGGN